MQRWLEARAAAGLARSRRTLQSPQGSTIVVDGRPCINFCSNDYLGLANHPALIAALKDGADRYGVGSGASPLICGYSKAHAELEAALARFTGREQALLFNNGYLANLAVVSAFAGRGDRILGDRLNHASLIDAAQLSRARLQRYPHADMGALAGRLATTTSNNTLVVSDGVFSMDGDMAPLPAIAELCRRHDARLLVDDAHGFGVLGRTGAGVLEQFSLTGADVPLLMATFGKALGCAGAFVAGDTTTIDYLLQTARPYIYSTAPPPALAVAARQALVLLEESPQQRERLHSLIAYYKKVSGKQGLPLSASDTPIQPLQVGQSQHALQLSEQLLAAGFYVAAIRPPTVPDGSARLRITLTAVHSEEQIDNLVAALVASLESLPA